MDNITLSREQITEFRRIVSRVYKKKFSYVDEEELFSAALHKFCNSRSYYNPAKSSIKTFMYNQIKNELSRLNSKNKRLTDIDVDIPLEFKGSLDRDNILYRESVEKFVKKIKDLKIPVCPFYLEEQLTTNCECKYTQVFLWERIKGNV